MGKRKKRIVPNPETSSREVWERAPNNDESLLKKEATY
jgi:hypothetical protein